MGCRKKGPLRLDHTSWGYAGSENGQPPSRSARLSGGGLREVGEAWAGLREFSRKSLVAFFVNNSQGLWKGGACAFCSAFPAHKSVRASRAQQAPPSLNGAVWLQLQVESLQSGP